MCTSINQKQNGAHYTLYIVYNPYFCIVGEKQKRKRNSVERLRILKGFDQFIFAGTEGE